MVNKVLADVLYMDGVPRLVCHAALHHCHGTASPSHHNYLCTLSCVEAPLNIYSKYPGSSNKSPGKVRSHIHTIAFHWVMKSIPAISVMINAMGKRVGIPMLAEISSRNPELTHTKKTGITFQGTPIL